MSLIEMKVDPAEIKAIRETLQELTQLLRAKLLADGYLKAPEPRRKTTIADVSITDEQTAWEANQKERAQQRRERELMDLTSQIPTSPESRKLNRKEPEDLGAPQEPMAPKLSTVEET